MKPNLKTILLIALFVTSALNVIQWQHHRQTVITLRDENSLLRATAQNANHLAYLYRHPEAIGLHTNSPTK